MTELFIKICNMSLTASYVILAVFLMRLFLNKLPKIFSYCLWAVVLFRLICPFSLESTWSLVRMDTEVLQENLRISGEQHATTGISTMSDQSEINQAVMPEDNANTSKGMNSVNLMQSVVTALTVIWLAGCILLAGCGIFSYWRLKKQMRMLTVSGDCQETVEYAGRKQVRILTGKGIVKPFVLGIIKPIIYMTEGLAEMERRYILAHEKTHIRRRDYLVKFGSYLVLCVYWMNPLVWLAFAGMSKDMEMSCDETVIKELNGEERKGYSSTLLEMAAGKNRSLAGPLAFGEGDAKGRIRNILNYRRPAFWVTVIGIMAVVGISIGLVLNPVKAPEIETWMNLTEETVTPAEWNPEEMASGLNGLRLDYEDENKLIFHNYDGLFIFDRERAEIAHSINLADVEYENPQRDQHYYCAVSVSPDGETVFFHTMNSEKIYVYTTADKTLRSMAYDTKTYIDFEKVDQAQVGVLAYMNAGDQAGIYFAEAGSDIYEPFILQGISAHSDLSDSVTYTYNEEEMEYLPRQLK